MSEICYKIIKYYVEFLGTNSSSEDQDLMARAFLFSDGVEGVAAEIKFYKYQRLWMKQDELSDPSLTTPILIGHMPYSEIGTVIDTLRNEEPIYILLPRASKYVLLTKEIYEGVIAGNYRY